MSEDVEKPLIIAYYLPQFHPIKENDEWWGEGFTEWTNVRKAKPLFKGHDQPRIPTELGYYDLRDPKIREEQVRLAKESGVGGFCYWHYWFNGKQLMNNIIDDVACNGPDFPFGLGWANETWSKKMWKKDVSHDRVLIEQTYGGLKDCRAHYEYVSKLFKKDNYIRIDGKPFFLVYKPENLPDPQLYIDLWNEWVKEDGIAEEIFFVGCLDNENDLDKYLNKGFSCLTPNPNPRVLECYRTENNIFNKAINKIKRTYFHIPRIIDMQEANAYIVNRDYDIQETVIPVLYPQWDHSPRSKEFVFVVVNSTPDIFREQAQIIKGIVHRKNNKIVMLKSWNEWAEGNYMEPDKTNGNGFIKALGSVFNS